MSQTVESAFKEKVIGLLDASGIYYERMQSGKVKVRGGWMQLCGEGTGDFVLFKYSQTPDWLELKPPGQITSKKREAAQAAFAEKVRMLGHGYYRCETLDDVKAALGTGVRSAVNLMKHEYWTDYMIQAHFGPTSCVSPKTA